MKIENPLNIKPGTATTIQDEYRVSTGQVQDKYRTSTGFLYLPLTFLILLSKSGGLEKNFIITKARTVTWQK